MPNQLRVLLVEDDVHDVERVERAFATLHPPLFELRHVPRFVDAIREIKERSYQVVIVDLGLPDSVGLNGIRRLMELIPSVPVIVLTGLEDDESAMDAIALGAQEFLDKNDVTTKQLIRTIRHAVKRKQISLQSSGGVTAHREAEKLQQLADVIRKSTAVVTSRVGSLLKTDLTTSQQSLVSDIQTTSLESAEVANQLAPSIPSVAEAIIEEDP